jgi:hypothetical protein
MLDNNVFCAAYVVQNTISDVIITGLFFAYAEEPDNE